MSYPVLFSALPNQISAIAGIAIARQSVVGSTVTGIGFLSGTQGLGALADCISCKVTEERNGQYELEMEYPITGIHFFEITQRCIIYAKANYLDGPQPFRIYKITKPLNGICTIYAAHLSYDLSSYEMPAGITASGVTEACESLSTYSGDFTITTDKAGESTFTTDVPASVRSWFGGKEGSLLDKYGGEWHWDGYTCELLQERGSDNGVTIKYGQNLTELVQDENWDNMYTAVRPYYISSDQTLIEGDLVYTGYALDFESVYFLDCSSYFGSVTPTSTQLENYARSYINANNMGAAYQNLTIDFFQHSELGDQINLCDTVTVVFEKLGILTQAKCVRTVWDVLLDRFTETTVGDIKITLTDTIIKKG